MSILNRLSLPPSPRLRRGHLDDAALAAIWTDASIAGGEPSHPHLLECAQCREGMEAFGTWMEGLRLDAVTEADEAFPAGRLAAQHAHIFRRIEAAEHPVRVIRFPTFSRPMAPGTSHARRWITAAAAAGLIVGVAVGQLTDVRRSLTGGATSAVFRPIVPSGADRPAARVQPAALVENDSDAAFMAEVDVSLTRNSLGQLRALDEITPRGSLLEDRRR